MKLLLPLKHYDEQGRVKAPWMLNLCLLFLARSYFVFVISAANMNDSGKLLSLIYPNKTDFYLGLLLGLPAVLCWGVASYRDKIWRAGAHRVFSLLKPVLLLSLLADIVLHLVIAVTLQWQFSWFLAGGLLFDGIFLMYVIRSHTLSVMLRDWRAESQL